MNEHMTFEEHHMEAINLINNTKKIANPLHMVPKSFDLENLIADKEIDLPKTSADH